MESIIYPSDQFNFKNIALGQPTVIQGGSYFTKITNNSGPLYLQTPSCGTKQGIISSGKKAYSDLMYTNEDIDILSWFEKLIERAQQLIFDKRKLWFHNEMEMEDIDSAFTPPIRIYKSGKFHLIRTYIHGSNINNPLQGFSCYDENEIKVDPEILNGGRRIIPLLEIKGIKFSSKSFNFDIALKQVMVIEETNFLNNCQIKINNQNQSKAIEAPVIVAPVIVKEAVVEAPVIVKEAVVETPVIVAPVIVKEAVVETPVIVKEAVVEASVIVKEAAVEQPESEDEQSNGDYSDTESIIDTTDAPPLLNLDLEEITITTDDIEDIIGNKSVNLKSANEAYIELWKDARKKAKQARRMAIEAHLDAKRIKTDNMLDNLDEDSEDEYFDDYVESLEGVEM